MFEKIRRPGRSRKEGQVKKWFSYFIFGLICLVFVFLAPMGTKLMGQGILGYVGSEPIRGREFRFVQENVQKQYQGRLDQADAETYSKIQKEIRDRALQYLVNHYLVVQGARKSGFSLSDKELQATIRSFPVFQENGRFLYSRYLNFLKLQKLSASRFEDQLRKQELDSKWREFFNKAALSNRLEETIKSEKYAYKLNFRYVEWNAGELEEQELEPYLQARDLKKIHQFLKKNKGEWKETGLFSLFSPFGIPIAQNQGLMDEVIHYLPNKGVLPKIIRQGDKIYLVEIRDFRKGKVSKEEERLENLLRRNFGKSDRLFISWVDSYKEQIKIELSEDPADF